LDKKYTIQVLRDIPLITAYTHFETMPSLTTNNYASFVA